MVALIYKTCQRNSIGILFAFFLFRLLMITCKPINYLSKYKLKGGGVCFLLFSCNPICACWDAHLDVIFFFSVYVVREIQSGSAGCPPSFVVSLSSNTCPNVSFFIQSLNYFPKNARNFEHNDFRKCATLILLLQHVNKLPLDTVREKPLKITTKWFPNGNWIKRKCQIFKYDFVDLVKSGKWRQWRKRMTQKDFERGLFSSRCK